jgi:hypothetical protein
MKHHAKTRDERQLSCCLRGRKEKAPIVGSTIRSYPVSNRPGQFLARGLGSLWARSSSELNFA